MATRRHIGVVTSAAGAASALTTLVVWIFVSNGVEVPLEVQGAITTLVVVLAGYLVPADRDGRHEA